VCSSDLFAGTPEANCIVEYLSRWNRMRPSINGDDLNRLGVPPGPAYRTILQSLRNAWLDGEINSTDEEGKLLKDLVNNGGSDLEG
jgi:tRNA nucleotidyltransferase (CCA-adding enzyme)